MLKMSTIQIPTEDSFLAMESLKVLEACLPVNVNKTYYINNPIAATVCLVSYCHDVEATYGALGNMVSELAHLLKDNETFFVCVYRETKIEGHAATSARISAVIWKTCYAD